ncbi:HXXEE domain-containing protein [Bacillus vallismortis]
MESLMWVFPIIFMFHEFEEIVFFVPWIKKNKKYLLNKYSGVRTT